MVEIPTNNSADLIAKQQAAHQEELDCIAQQFLGQLAKSDSATVECEEHMIGYQGSRAYHHLCDTKEVALMFKKKGYYCYYYDYYNNGGVNQRAVCVRKTPMSESAMTRGNRTWHSI